MVPNKMKWLLIYFVVYMCLNCHTKGFNAFSPGHIRITITPEALRNYALGPAPANFGLVNQEQISAFFWTKAFSK